MIKDFLSKVRVRRKVIDSHAVMVAFPRCGLSRLRDLLWNFMTLHYGIKGGRTGDFFQLWKQDKSRVPRLFVTNDDNPHTCFPDEIRDEKTIFDGKKVVFLSRDPRNVIASLYYRRSRRGYIDSNYYWGTLTDFIREGEGGFETLLTYYASWTSPERVKVHHLCYEDLHSNPSNELKRVTEFLGIKKVDPDHYERAVKQTPAFGDKNTEYESIPRNSAYLKPELPTNEDSDGVTESEEEPKEPYLREFEEEDLHWLRAQMDAFLPVEFPFYREDIN